MKRTLMLTVITAVLAVQFASSQQDSPAPMVNWKDGQIYVWIPSGRFMLGCPFAKGFRMGRTEVTLAEGGGSKAKNNDAYIGTATMTKDGTIVLDLRSKARDGTIGEARLVYPKSHKQYSEILKHLGGLKPGQTKLVTPWPDKK